MKQEIKKFFFFFLLLAFSMENQGLLAQDSVLIRVHFLYGSRPKRKFRATEPAWFGGILGGHVGIETDSNVILNFNPHGKFHWFAKNNDRHSRFAIHSIENFWLIMGSDSVKKASIVIPISSRQKQRLDSLSTAYCARTPYDYAFIGMRCAAAAYDVLSRIGVVKKYSYHKTYRAIFYPRKLRKRLLKKARRHHWQVIREKGSKKRKWERDW